MEDFLKDLGFNDNLDRLKGILESVLFASGEAMSKRDIKDRLNINEKTLKNIIDQMNKDYDGEGRGLILIEFNDKIQLSTKPEYSEYIKRFIKVDSRQNLSQAAIETLAIIAYKQPITKVEIDEIRGVRSDRAIQTLTERNLIKEGGRLETTGRPILYCTTDDFLKYFGFKNLEELPELIEFNMNFVEE